MFELGIGILIFPWIPTDHDDLQASEQCDHPISWRLHGVGNGAESTLDGSAVRIVLFSEPVPSPVAVRRAFPFCKFCFT